MRKLFYLALAMLICSYISVHAATLEGGAVVNVPFFISVGDVLKIDTRTNEFLSRI